MEQRNQLGEHPGNGTLWKNSKINPSMLRYHSFVYTAQARTLAGVVYPYLEMDYYVPSLPYPCAMQMGSSSTVFGHTCSSRKRCTRGST
jgi:hypothetical protein